MKVRTAAHRSGFTIIEVIITIGVMTFLVASITLVYLTCFKAFSAGQDRAKIRTKLSQALEIMTREIYYAQRISACNENLLTITANFGSGSASYSYYLYNSSDAGPYTLPHTYSQSTYSLMRAEGAYSDAFSKGTVKAENVSPPGTAIFSCTSGVITIDMTSVLNGETVHVRTNVKPRNLNYGLAGWWKFDEGSGTGIFDSSGNGIYGTLTNSPAWVAGHIGSGALSFNGTTAYVALGSISKGFNFSGDITGSAWIKTSTDGKIILQYQDNTPLIYMQVGVSTVGGPANKFCAVLRTNGNVLKSVGGTTTVTNNTWHHVAFTRNTTAGEVKVYVDGTLEATSAWVNSEAIDTSKSRSESGVRHVLSNPDSFFFNGSMDDVRMYNVVLSDNEIAGIYAQYY